jgi:hypothetical protein
MNSLLYSSVFKLWLHHILMPFHSITCSNCIRQVGVVWDIGVQVRVQVMWTPNTQKHTYQAKTYFHHLIWRQQNVKYIIRTLDTEKTYKQKIWTILKYINSGMMWENYVLEPWLLQNASKYGWHLRTHKWNIYGQQMYDLTINVATHPLNLHDVSCTQIPEIPAKWQILNGHYHTNLQVEDQQIRQHRFL